MEYQVRGWHHGWFPRTSASVTLRLFNYCFFYIIYASELTNSFFCAFEKLLYTISMGSIMGDSQIIIPTHCKAGVVVNEGPDFHVEVQMVPVPEPGKV